MDGFVKDRPEMHLGQEQAEKLKEAERAFQNRPRVSIRMRIVAGFLLCFFLTAATALVTLAVLYEARAKVRFLQTTQDLSFEIHEARRFEKDYFLYGTGLAEAQTHAGRAVAILRAQTVNVLDVAGEENLARLDRHLGAYDGLLRECAALERGGEPEARARQAVEAGLRENGALAIELVRSLELRESSAVDRMLSLSQAVPFLFLALLLVLLFWVAHLLARTITRSLERFHGYTNRIAAGDFSPIRPAKPYRDEFSDLALATNRMLFELRSRESQAIRAGKLAAVGTFTTGIAHELINPLTNVLITSESLMEECQTMRDDRRYRLVEEIYSEAERAADTVRGLLDYTRETRPTLEPVEPHDLVAASARLLRNEMALAGVALRDEVPEAFPPLLGDFTQLRQVLLNLLLNAVQAMPNGGAITLRAGRLEGARACLEVADEGVGIPAEELPRVFDPFFTTKERGKGTGLGLSISYAIVKRHGGEMQIESEPGRGTTVHLCLPLAPRGGGGEPAGPDPPAT